MTSASPADRLSGDLGRLLLLRWTIGILVLLIVGLWIRAAALVVVVLNMVVAVALAHRADVFRPGDTGGWAIELQALYLLGAAAIALLGAAALGVGGAQGRWN